MNVTVTFTADEAEASGLLLRLGSAIAGGTGAAADAAGLPAAAPVPAEEKEKRRPRKPLAAETEAPVVAPEAALPVAPASAPTLVVEPPAEIATQAQLMEAVNTLVGSMIKDHPDAPTKAKDFIAANYTGVDGLPAKLKTLRPEDRASVIKQFSTGKL